MAKRRRLKPEPGGSDGDGATSDEGEPAVLDPVWKIQYLDEELGIGNGGGSGSTSSSSSSSSSRTSGPGRPTPKRRKVSLEPEGGDAIDIAAKAREGGYTLDMNPQMPHSERVFKSGSLDRWYRVQPDRVWESLSQYLTFEWHGIKHAVGGCVDVHGEGNERYVGRIVDIRARDAQHVNLLVCWLYFPRELPVVKTYGGRSVHGKQLYHGKSEVLASNHMDIIPAYSVNGPVTIDHWNEKHDDEDGETVDGPKGASRLYWRQAYDLKTGELSYVEQRCACKQPENPDKPLIRCDKCKLWLHTECVEQAAKEAETKKHKQKFAKGRVKATLEVKEGKMPKLVIQSCRKGSSKAESTETLVHCLDCKQPIE
ncbi:hypothetical protein MKZ38_010135 [Zalerion maritima]|uniref:BAH domain-containing protein n=1 Tax=Zalerion maritima TaxID=339359 RepID=A0AAD5RFS9_9PEZI|nr:hypothetical protein MKZ38_010135 [Zalerion maritima]